MHKIIRRRTITADQLRDGVLLDFEDEDPGMVSEVKHLSGRVLFTARGAQFSLDRDEQIILVTRMQLVNT